jgi:transposase
MLRSWKRQAEGSAGFAAADVFPGNGNVPSQDDAVRRLRREVDQLRQERDFLKKATAYFATELR